MEIFWAKVVNLVWGLPLVIIMATASCYFAYLIRFAPLRYLRHSFLLLAGRFNSELAPGEVSHFRALSTALSGTIGMGNIAGVAVAISAGGSGAVFWMWIAGLLGMATKFFTCTLSCMYRKADTRGVMQGGPMYYIEVGLGQKFKPLAMLFAVFGMVGCLGVFQSNQLAQLLDNQWSFPPLATGIIAMLIVGGIVTGGSVRIGRVAGTLVPLMCAIYIVGSLLVVVDNIELVPTVFASIIYGAFTPEAGIGGAAGVTFREVLVMGVRRAVFSNEAGVGTEALAHGAAQTSEPVREGLVGMLGPFIDTHLICTLTALVILTAGLGVSESDTGIIMAANAFESSVPGYGANILSVAFALFAVTTMTTYAYYSIKCARYLLGEVCGSRFVYIYLLFIPVAALWNSAMTINMIDTFYAMMIVPNLIATILLAPKVVAAASDYFNRYDRTRS